MLQADELKSLARPDLETLCAERGMEVGRLKAEARERNADLTREIDAQMDKVKRLTRELADARAALRKQPCRCKCKTHGFGCGLQEATCQQDYSYKCSRCAALSRQAEGGGG
jgi:hypothetical protein